MLVSPSFLALVSLQKGHIPSKGHFNFVTDSGIRAAFVSSAVQFVEDYGFDGM